MGLKPVEWRIHRVSYTLKINFKSFLTILNIYRQWKPGLLQRPAAATSLPHAAGTATTTILLPQSPGKNFQIDLWPFI